MTSHLSIAADVLVMASANPFAQAQTSPAALAAALQSRYQSIRDFSADFQQTYRAGVLKTKTQERGTVAIKKPGKMRWTYSKPQRKELVSDGSTMHWYDPEARQVERWDVPDQATTPDLFLSADGQSYVYGSPRMLSTLYLVTGLK